MSGCWSYVGHGTDFNGFIITYGPYVMVHIIRYGPYVMDHIGLKLSLWYLKEFH